jgi:hypothetical protein
MYCTFNFALSKDVLEMLLGTYIASKTRELKDNFVQYYKTTTFRSG